MTYKGLDKIYMRVWSELGARVIIKDFEKGIPDLAKKVFVSLKARGTSFNLGGYLLKFESTNEASAWDQFTKGGCNYE